MKIVNSIEQWTPLRRSLPSNQSLGFVPTMGNLHQGHTSLLTNSVSDNDLTVASLFVNPTQFNQRDDFDSYPRTLEADLDKLRDAGTDFCLIPDESMMYPDGYHYRIEENQLTQRMEGTQRPGHFNGVLTVVMKLFNLVKPQRAYFGEKDYQQLQLIRGMVSAFFMDIEIKPCPTVREPSQLALSSRNNRLTPQQKTLAEQFATIFHQNKQRGKDHCQQIATALETIGIHVEYIEEHQQRRFAAVRIGDVRLIDNYTLY